MAIVDVSGTAAFPVDPQVTIPFEPRTVLVFNEDADQGDDAHVSFDGVGDHGRFFAGEGRTYEQRTRLIWLRRGLVGSPPTNIQVVAES